MTLRSHCRALAVVLAVFPLTGCLFRTRTVERQLSTAPLKSATQKQLIDYINHEAAKIRSMNAMVDIDTTVGGEKKGKATDYTEIRGYVLARKPSMLHMIGLMPVVRTKAFDMVSDGDDFKLSIPPKNRFVEGRNDVPTPNPKNSLENLRPQHIYDALLLREIDEKKGEVAVMEDDFELVAGPKGRKVEQPDYEVIVIRKNDDKGWYLSRKIIFSRTDLLPHRQIVYDEDANQATDSRYEGYKDYDGVNFPSQIEINRPKEEYDIVLHIVKLQLNQPLSDDQFRLEQPPGSEIIHLDQPKSSQLHAKKEEARR
jgi:outer membrane lipoprotein-sorting protein